MEFWLLLLSSALLAVIAILICRLISVRRGVCEIVRELTEKLETDTNTGILVSSRDRALRSLARTLNLQLDALVKERRRLQNGDRELNEAITNISHDLRTPLTAICGYLELLEAEPVGEKAGRYLEIIRERTDAMKTLTEELFHYSMIRSASEDLQLEAVCLNGALEESFAAFYGAMTERGIVPEIQMPDEPVFVQANREALQRVLGNVLSNASKYADGDVKAVLEPDGAVVISNSAEALSQVQVQNLFDRFYTVHSGRNSTGLGLSIAKLLMGKMGGGITADYAAGILSIRLCFSTEV